MSERTYSIRELTELTGVSRRTIRLWVEQGIIAPADNKGRCARWTEAHRSAIEAVNAIRNQRVRMTDIPKMLNGPT